MKFGTQNVKGQLDNTTVVNGILIPRLTNSQESAVATPVESELIYNVDLSTFRYYNGTSWQNLTSSGTGNLQDAYDNSVGGATPEILIDVTRGAVSIRDNSVGTMLDAQDGSGTSAVTLGISGLRAVDGSASTPSLSFLSDPNSGIFSISPDVVGIATNGSTALTLSSAGALRLNAYTAGYLQTDGSGNVTAAPLPASSPTFTGTAGENIAAGAIVAIINSSGPKIVNADSDGDGNRIIPVGVATAAALNGATVTVQYGAKLPIPDAQWDSIPATSDIGSLAYLSETGTGATSGFWTITSPTTPGSTVVKCGVVSDGGSGSVEVIIQIGDITILA